MFEHSPGSAHDDTQILHPLVLLLDLFKAADSGWSKVGNMSYAKINLQDLIHSRNKIEVMIINYANPVYGVATICHQVRWLQQRLF